MPLIPRARVCPGRAAGGGWGAQPQPRLGGELLPVAVGPCCPQGHPVPGCSPGLWPLSSAGSTGKESSLGLAVPEEHREPHVGKGFLSLMCLSHCIPRPVILP